MSWSEHQPVARAEGRKTGGKLAVAFCRRGGEDRRGASVSPGDGGSVEQYVFVRLHAREGEEGMVEEVLRKVTGSPVRRWAA